MGRIVFHIGWAKTGSTSLQQFMAAKRAELRELGFYYPPNIFNPNNLQDPRNLAIQKEMKGASHSIIFKEMIPGPIGPRGQRVSDHLLVGAFANACDAFERSECHTMVLSNENAFWRSGEIDSAPLMKRAAEFALELIVYFRRYDDYYLSLFKQRIKARNAPINFADFVNWHLTMPGPRAHIRTMAERFGGRLVVRSYDAVGRQIVPDFLQAVGVPVGFGAVRKDAATQKNPSFSDLLTLFLLDLHRRGLPADLAEETREWLRKEARRGQLPTDLPHVSLMSESVRRTLLDRYNADLRTLKEEGLADIPEIDFGTFPLAGASHRDHLADGDFDAVAESLPPKLRQRLQEAAAHSGGRAS